MYGVELTLTAYIDPFVLGSGSVSNRIDRTSERIVHGAHVDASPGLKRSRSVLIFTLSDGCIVRGPNSEGPAVVLFAI